MMLRERGAALGTGQHVDQSGPTYR